MTTASLLGILFFTVGVPTVTGLLFAFPQHRRWFIFLMVFSICYIRKPLYQEVLFQNYRGVDRGFAVTVPDLFFFGFALYFLLGGAKQKLNWLPFNSIPWILLVLVSLFSLVGSLKPLYGLFTVHKMIRCLVLYWVVVNLLKDKEDILSVFRAFAFTILYQFWNVFVDKYVTGAVVVRSIGTFRHPNTLTMYTNLINPILLAVLLSNTLPTKGDRLLVGTAVVLGLICVIFTKSRAGIMFAPTALGVTLIISFLMKPSLHKTKILVVGMIAALAIGYLALPRIINRFLNAPKESAETREYFNVAAEAMADDRLFGVGINLYSYSLEFGEYYWLVYPDKVDINDPEEFRQSVQGKSRLGTAHHIYWLYAAEVGYPGLYLFVLHCGIFSLSTMWVYFREKDAMLKAVLLGMIVSTSVHHVHGLLEWIFRQTEVQYLYFVLGGTMVAIWRLQGARAAATAKARIVGLQTGEPRFQRRVTLPEGSV